MPTTYRDIVTDALKEIGVVSQGESPNASDTHDALGKLHRLLNNWNADRRAVYATAFLQFTLVGSLSPHTIGPSGATWTVTQRPVTIDGANLILGGSPNDINQPITIRDAQWWLSQTVPTLSDTIPTDLYYQPDWPNGQLYFWPVPSAAYAVRLMVRVLLDDTVSITDAFSLPPGYQDAITLTLAEECGPMFAANVSDITHRSAQMARARVFANNDVVPKLCTSDGQGTAPRTQSNWNYRTGQVMR